MAWLRALRSLYPFFTDVGMTETKNVINAEHGGYDNVNEYIPIAQPNAGTLAKLAALEPSTVYGERERGGSCPIS